MDFDLNEDMVSSRGYSPDDKTEADYGWWETVGLQFKKDTITEMSFSENLQYNKTKHCGNNDTKSHYTRFCSIRRTAYRLYYDQHSLRSFCISTYNNKLLQDLKWTTGNKRNDRKLYEKPEEK